MPNYRRNYVPGATFFFTLTLATRFPNDLLVREVDALRAAVRKVRGKYPFRIDACVVLPDHLHFLWTLPAGDSDYPLRIRLVKSFFSRSIPRDVGKFHGKERGVWQRRYWEHTIRNQADFNAHMDYIHFNPVKHGYVERVSDWQYSTFHRLARGGVYPIDWAGDATPIFSVGE